MIFGDSLTLSCKLVEVFAMICGVCFATKSSPRFRRTLALNPAFSVSPSNLLATTAVAVTDCSHHCVLHPNTTYVCLLFAIQGCLGHSLVQGFTNLRIGVSPYRPLSACKT